MSHVFRRPADPRPAVAAPALLFPSNVSEVLDIAAGAVSVAGSWIYVLARLAVSLKRFAVSLNDING